MASYPNIRDTPRGIDIEKWNEAAVESLNRLSIHSPNGIRGTTVSLAIDLDEHGEPQPAKPPVEAYRPRRILRRRDSLERREALLKGKEGSRRRTRWENANLLNNPWAQPPLPGDWEVHPTYPRRHVPYYLAPLWDQGMAARVEAEKAAAQKQQRRFGAQGGTRRPGQVPRELREKIKRAKAAKGLLRDLEEQVRGFVQACNEEKYHGHGHERYGGNKGAQSDSDVSDEEIVFVGRQGKMRDVSLSPELRDARDSLADLRIDTANGSEPGLYQQQLIFNGPADDRAARFGRWLVHNIAQYYGLRTWSRTTGNPARREAYVGIPPGGGRSIAEQDWLDQSLLLKPLWRLI